MTQLASLRAAIKGVCDGSLGTIRVVRSDMRYASASDLNDRVRALEAPRFDVLITAAKLHASSPMTIKADTANWVHSITIQITHALGLEISEADRVTVRDNVVDALVEMTQALMYPGNLATDESGNATGVVSGMNRDTEWEVVAEDWGARLMRSQIKGTIIVQQLQEVAA